jgi:hypothetical protein
MDMWTVVDEGHRAVDDTPKTVEDRQVARFGPVLPTTAGRFGATFEWK